MKKISILLMFAFLVGLTVNAQTKKRTHINQFGLPLITSYPRNVYGGHAQNNSVVSSILPIRRVCLSMMVRGGI